MEKREFAQRLSELRIQKGVSARDMSLSLGLGEAYINNVENCQGFPSMAAFFDICDFLGVTPEDFFSTGKHNPTKSHKLVELCNQLPPDQFEHVLSLVKDLLK